MRASIWKTWNTDKKRGALAHALRKLETSLAQLVEGLSHEAVWIELQEKGSNGDPLRRACEALATIDYMTHEDTEQSVVCVGAIGVAPDMMMRVKLVNAAKQEFKDLCTALHRTQVRVPVKGGSGTTPVPLTRVLLASIQRSNVNLLSAYRKIPTLDAHPNTISYTAARTRAVYRKTVGELEDMLTEREYPNAAEDREKLANLPAPETHLAFAKDRYVNFRANVLYSRLDRRGRGRAQFAAELPLMFIMRSKDKLPIVTFPAITTHTSIGPQRRRQLIEDTPFLHSLPVYRYIQQAQKEITIPTRRRRPAL